MRSHCCNSFLCGNAIWDCPNLHLILSACRAPSPDNSAADQPSTCSRTTIKPSLAGEEHRNLEKETKGHPPQRSCQILRPSILRYTCHPEMCVAGISTWPAAINPPPNPHELSTAATQGGNQIIFYILTIKAKMEQYLLSSAYIRHSVNYIAMSLF